MLGLKRGTVALISHQDEWDKNAENTIVLLKELLGDVFVEIQHIGSTSIPAIHAKPIIDIVVGVRDLNDVTSYIESLKQHGIVFRGEDVAGQMLFVIGDFENDMLTHHIHIAKWSGIAWNNYINFRDYLNTFPEKAMQYDVCKQKLALRFSDDRKSYTAGKQELVDCLLKEACAWKENL